MRFNPAFLPSRTQIPGTRNSVLTAGSCFIMWATNRHLFDAQSRWGEYLLLEKRNETLLLEMTYFLASA